MRLKHLLKNILVADVGPEHADSGFPERDLQTHVRHCCGHDRIAIQPSLGMQVASCRKQHGISVDDATVVIAEKSAVGVAVEGYAEIEFSLRFGHGLAQRIWMQSSALFVDVPAIGRNMNKCCLNTERAKEFRSLGSRGAVSAVDQNTH